MLDNLKADLTRLYTGNTKTARRFRYGLIAFDVVTIFAFIAMAPFPQSELVENVSFLFGLLILLDFMARLWIEQDRAMLLRRIYVIADIIVIISLMTSPFTEVNTAFLRILRGLRLVHSYQLLGDLRRASTFFYRNERTMIALINLFVFVFFTASFVFAVFAHETAGVAGYIDALYFTVSTLTTTGYGDITPTTPSWKLFSVVIMVVGVSLFVQLVRAIFQPAKVEQECERCGLLRHDPDAVHCKHCGDVVHIKTPGFD